MKKCLLMALPFLLLTGCAAPAETSPPDSPDIVVSTEKIIEAPTETESFKGWDFPDAELELVEVESEKEAQDFVEGRLHVPDGDITIQFEGSDSNMVQTWYDFSECYQGIPIWGNNIRLHVREDDTGLLQGGIITGEFETADVLLDAKEVLNGYAKNESQRLQYSEPKLYYLNMSERVLPLCYYYSSIEKDVFLSAVTGELLWEHSNVIIG